MAPWLSIHSPTTKWGEGGGASHQRGAAFPRPPGRLLRFSIKGRLLSIHRRHYNPRPERPSNLSPLSTFGPAGRQPSSPIGACHNPIAKPPGLSSRGFMIPFPSGGKGQGLYPHITVLHISSHPAWRDEGGVIGEARLFSGLPWPGVRGGILQPVSFPP